MGLFDYPKVIKKPMDLGTVKRNIVDRKYQSLPEAAEDVALVWKNCMTYNADGSDFFILAQNLNRKWQENFKKLLDDLGLPASTMSASELTGSAGGRNANNKLTLDEKRAFAKSLYKLNKDELGRVLVEIEKNYPAALTRSAAEDEIEFNVDRLPAGLFTVRYFVGSRSTILVYARAFFKDHYVVCGSSLTNNNFILLSSQSLQTYVKTCTSGSKPKKKKQKT